MGELKGYLAVKGTHTPMSFFTMPEIDEVHNGFKCRSGDVMFRTRQMPKGVVTQSGDLLRRIVVYLDVA